MELEGDSYNKSIVDKLKRIMTITDLDVNGFAEFLGRQSSHIYGILNGSRILSIPLARLIGEKLGFDGTKILNPNYLIPAKISRSENLISFKKDNAANSIYFASKKIDRSVNRFVLDVLIPSGLFSEPRYLFEALQFSKKHFDKDFSSDQLSKALRYTVKTGSLRTNKERIKLKNGEYGSRLVDVYYV